jgi:LacI family transcriptional regulator
MTDELKNILNRTKIPVVLIGGSKEEHDFDIVSMDNYQGAFNATEYLIKKKKFKKIAHITGPAENYDAYRRKKGFIDACKKNGVSINKSFIVDGNYTIDSGYHAFIQLYGLPEKPQAIFAANDMMALGCYDAANYFNVKIPDDISIIGFDDIFMSKYINPSLTTVRVQIEEVGKTAASLLIERLNKSNGKAHSLIKIPTELIIRNSC